MSRLAAGLAALVMTIPAAAQERDFLTTNEADQVRLAQEPNQRLNLYVVFAKQRLDQMEQLAKEDRPGRSALIHDLLEQYTEIIDAIDTIADEALRKKVDIAPGMKIVADAEKEFAAQLRRLQEAKPADMGRYEFVLGQAIDATDDSLEAANEDLGKRTEQVVAREKREQEKLEGLMQPKDLEAKRAEQKKQAEAAKKERKRPSLLKPGEKAKADRP
ncbi:MAG TPA: hypothetical protein VN428_14900 [Bryobacteraceae bacterium]|nr:hypothetical protein [Bryobacteraceae bacterium]